MTPHYSLAVVVISENKDTAVCFPPLPQAVAVEGAGFAGARGIAAMRGSVRCRRPGLRNCHVLPGERTDVSIVRAGRRG